MASQTPARATKELSKKTWPDFVRLFSQKNGWDHCWCVHFQRPCSVPKSEWLPTRAERAVRNRRVRRKLLESGRSHGILVYEKGEPVGWCQYGPREEFPRIDNGRNYRGLAPEGGAEKLWRITCFVVDRKYRRRGIAGTALKAALEAIKKRGGGLMRPIRLRDGKGLSETCPRMELFRCSRRRGSRLWRPLVVPTC
jgi:GNAT superfamily N-acetyltransferase